MITLPIELLRQFRKGFFSLRHLYKFEFLSKTYRWTDADVPIYANVDGSSQWWNPKGIKFDNIESVLDPSVDGFPLTLNNAKWEISNLILAEDIMLRPVTIWRAAIDRNMDTQGSLLVFYGFCDSFEFDQREAIIEICNHRILWKRKTLRTHDPTCCRIFTDPTTCMYTGASDVTTAIRVQANAGATTIEVDATAGMNTVDSKISIIMDNGQKHWSKIASITDADTLVIADAVPAGRYAPVDAEVKTMRWCDHSWERCGQMSNQVNFPGFRWLQYLEDKELWWGRAPK